MKLVSKIAITTSLYVLWVMMIGGQIASAGLWDAIKDAGRKIDPTNPNSKTREGLRKIDPTDRKSKTREVLREADPTNPNSSVGYYLRQGLIPPVIREYFQYLHSQANYKEIPPKLRNILASKYQYFSIYNVRYAENIDTVHGQAITVGNKIYFPRSVNFKNYSDLHWLLHELEHVSQYYAHGGREAFLLKYFANGALEIGRNGSFDIHDAINLERDAENKADRIIDYAWYSLNASPNSPRYAVLCIRNETNLNINYSFKWGNNSSWKQQKISSQRAIWHSHSYEYPGENKSPTFYVNFDYNLLAGQDSRKEYTLTRQSATEQNCSQAKQYKFKYTDSAKTYIDLYKE